MLSVAPRVAGLEVLAIPYIIEIQTRQEYVGRGGPPSTSVIRIGQHLFGLSFQLFSKRNLITSLETRKKLNRHKNKMNRNTDLAIKKWDIKEKLIVIAENNEAISNSVKCERSTNNEVIVEEIRSVSHAYLCCICTCVNATEKSMVVWIRKSDKVVETTWWILTALFATDVTDVKICYDPVR